MLSPAIILTPNHQAKTTPPCRRLSAQAVHRHLSPASFLATSPLVICCHLYGFYLQEEEEEAEEEKTKTFSKLCLTCEISGWKSFHLFFGISHFAMASLPVVFGGGGVGSLLHAKFIKANQMRFPDIDKNLPKTFV